MELIEEKIKRKKDHAKRRKNNFIHKKRKLKIIREVPCFRNELIGSRNGKYYTYSNFKKSPIKKQANKKVRKTDVGNFGNYKKAYDLEWKIS